MAWLGLELLSQHLNLKLHPSLHLDLHCGAIAKYQGPSFRLSDEDITPERTFIVTKDANIGIGTNVPSCQPKT